MHSPSPFTAGGAGPARVLRPMGALTIDYKKRARLVHARGALLSPAGAYPNTTSSASMMVNPAAKNSVPRLEWLPAEASGISSSTTT